MALEKLALSPESLGTGSGQGTTQEVLALLRNLLDTGLPRGAQPGSAMRLGQTRRRRGTLCLVARGPQVVVILSPTQDKPTVPSAEPRKETGKFTPRTGEPATFLYCFFRCSKLVLIIAAIITVFAPGNLPQGGKGDEAAGLGFSAHLLCVSHRGQDI